MFFYDQQLKSISFYPKIIKNYRKLFKNFDDHVLVTKIRYAIKITINQLIYFGLLRRATRCQVSKTKFILTTTSTTCAAIKSTPKSHELFRGPRTSWRDKENTAWCQPVYTFKKY